MVPTIGWAERFVGKTMKCEQLYLSFLEILLMNKLAWTISVVDHFSTCGRRRLGGDSLCHWHTNKNKNR